MSDFMSSPNHDGVAFSDLTALLSAHLLSKLKTADQTDEWEEEAESDDEQEGSELSSSEICTQGSEAWRILDDMCWTLYSKQGLPKELQEELGLESLHQLWQWFVLFSRTDDAGVVQCPVLMVREELGFWLHYLFAELMALPFCDHHDFEESDKNFLEVVTAVVNAGRDLELSRSELEQAVFEFYNEVVCSLQRKVSKAHVG